ncbi:MAG: DUF1566 domain-containing protein, partial [Thermodesulfobacteriota bacterium]
LAACGDGGGETGPTGGSATVDTGSSVGAINLAATGLTASIAAGDDGALQIGIKPSQSPRYHANGNGTITDTMTGLMWMQNTDCFRYDVYGYYTLCKDTDGDESRKIFAEGYNCSDIGSPNTEITSSSPGDGRVGWALAQQYAGWQNTREVNCGTTSRYTDWRLPTVIEIESVIDFSVPGSSLGGAPFTNVADDYIWSGTETAGGSAAWAVNIYTGEVLDIDKVATPNGSNSNIVWLVRNDENYFK